MIVEKMVHDYGVFSQTVEGLWLGSLSFLAFNMTSTAFILPWIFNFEIWG